MPEGGRCFHEEANRWAGVKDAGANTGSLVLYGIQFLETVFAGGAVNYASVVWFGSDVWGIQAQ